MVDSLYSEHFVETKNSFDLWTVGAPEVSLVGSFLRNGAEEIVSRIVTSRLYFSVKKLERKEAV